MSPVFGSIFFCIFLNCFLCSILFCFLCACNYHLFPFLILYIRLLLNRRFSMNGSNNKLEKLDRKSTPYSSRNRPKNACPNMRAFTMSSKRKTLMSVFTFNRRNCVVRKNTHYSFSLRTHRKSTHVWACIFRSVPK